MKYADSGLVGFNGKDCLTFSGGDTVKLPRWVEIAMVDDGRAMVLRHPGGGPILKLGGGLLAGIAAVAVWRWLMMLRGQ